MAWMNARGPPRRGKPPSSKQLARSILIFSIVMLVGGLTSLVFGGLAPTGNPSRALLRYMIVIVGAAGVAYSAYLLTPSFAERFDRRTTEWLALPAANRVHRLRNMALATLAVMILIEVTLAVVLWPLPGWQAIVIGMFSGTLILLVSMVASMIQQASGRPPPPRGKLDVPADTLLRGNTQDQDDARE